MNAVFHRRGLACLIAATALFASAAAPAAIVGSTTDIDFTGSSTSFSYLGGTFTLQDNGSGFPSPVSGSTGGNGQFAKDFFGISIFFDPPRNDELVDSAFQFASFPSATVISFSATPSFIGLAATGPDGVHFGYAEFSGTLFEGFAFQSAPNVGIAFGAALVPEPGVLALLGIGLAGIAFRRRRAA